MSSFWILIFFSTIVITINADEFKLIKGYSVIADTLDTTATATLQDCYAHCSSLGKDCSGALFFDVSPPLISTCITFKRIRNIIANAVSCPFYIYDRRESYKAPSNLSETDQMIFANTYMDGPCPRGAIDNIKNCILNTTKTRCLEYAAFFGPTYNGTHCVMKLAQPRQDYYCIPRGSMSTSYFTSTSKKCYFNIDVPANYTISYYNTRCKVMSSLSQLPTICDNQTNVFFQNFNGNQRRLLGLYAPAGTKTLKWLDGSNCTFRGWSRPGYSAYYNPNGGETYIINFDYWASATRVNYAKTPYHDQTCQEPAYTLAEYWTKCATLDNCAQINKK